MKHVHAEAGKNIKSVVVYKEWTKNIMTIDIEQLSEKELIDLNHRIIQRLNFLEAVQANSEMVKFSIGEKVSFKPSGKERQVGILVKYNKKTVTVLTDKGARWNISPEFLMKVVNVCLDERKEREKIMIQNKLPDRDITREISFDIKKETDRKG